MPPHGEGPAKPVHEADPLTYGLLYTTSQPTANWLPTARHGLGHQRMPKAPGRYEPVSPLERLVHFRKPSGLKVTCEH
jgi:hypothetical protein